MRRRGILQPRTFFVLSYDWFWRHKQRIHPERDLFSLCRFYGNLWALDTDICIYAGVRRREQIIISLRDDLWQLCTQLRCCCCATAESLVGSSQVNFFFSSSLKLRKEQSESVPREEIWRRWRNGRNDEEQNNWKNSRVSRAISRSAGDIEWRSWNLT